MTTLESIKREQMELRTANRMKLHKADYHTGNFENCDHCKNGLEDRNVVVVEKVVIDLNTGKRQELVAEVSSTKDQWHHTYSLTYDGYRSDWMEVA